MHSDFDCCWMFWTAYMQTLVQQYKAKEKQWRKCLKLWAKQNYLQLCLVKILQSVNWLGMYSDFSKII